MTASPLALQDAMHAKLAWLHAYWKFVWDWPLKLVKESVLLLGELWKLCRTLDLNWFSAPYSTPPRSL